jgi:hypothetical protein
MVFYIHREVIHIEYEFKTNGYQTPAEWIDCINDFDSRVKYLFKNQVSKIYHFNYANLCIMSTVVLSNGNYCGFRLAQKCMCTDGWTCKHDELLQFESLINI